MFHRRVNRGFTLVELLVVIAIIGILISLQRSFRFADITDGPSNTYLPCRRTE